MPEIRPSADLRNKYAEISEFCHRYNEPVYITKNGVGDLVALSIEAYEKLVGKFELFSLLEAGLQDIESGRTKPAADVFANLEKELTK